MYSVMISRGSRLHVSAVTVEDAGRYECRGQNVAGPLSSMTSNVVIHDPGKQQYCTARRSNQIRRAVRITWL